jgi:hypothetical protein
MHALKANPSAHAPPSTLHPSSPDGRHCPLLAHSHTAPLKCGPKSARFTSSVTFHLHPAPQYTLLYHTSMMLCSCLYLPRFIWHALALQVRTCKLSCLLWVQLSSCGECMQGTQKLLGAGACYTLLMTRRRALVQGSLGHAYHG